MTEEYTTRTAEVWSLEPHEDAKIPLFEALSDDVIANSPAQYLRL